MYISDHRVSCPFVALFPQSSLLRPFSHANHCNSNSWHTVAKYVLSFVLFPYYLSTHMIFLSMEKIDFNAHIQFVSNFIFFPQKIGLENPLRNDDNIRSKSRAIKYEQECTLMVWFTWSARNIFRRRNRLKRIPWIIVLPKTMPTPTANNHIVTCKYKIED